MAFYEKEIRVKLQHVQQCLEVTKHLRDDL